MEGIRKYIEDAIASRKKKTFGTIIKLGPDQADIRLPDGSIIHGVIVIGGVDLLKVGDNVPVVWAVDPRFGYERPIVYGSGVKIIRSGEIGGTSYVPVPGGVPQGDDYGKIHRGWIPLEIIGSIVVFGNNPPSPTVPGMIWIDTSV